MGTSLQRANAWSQLVIGAGIEVHRIKGAWLLEEIYSKYLGRECELRNIPFVREVRAFLEYKGLVFEQPLRLDFLVDDGLIGGRGWCGVRARASRITPIRWDDMKPIDLAVQC
jgi:hypothetical protein